MPLVIPTSHCSPVLQERPSSSSTTTAKMPLLAFFSKKNRRNSGLRVGQSPPASRTGTQSSSMPSIKSSIASSFRSSATRRPGKRFLSQAQEHQLNDFWQKHPRIHSPATPPIHHPAILLLPPSIPDQLPAHPLPSRLRHPTILTPS